MSAARCTPSRSTAVPVDLGAHWVGPTQRRVLALADELGVEVEKQYLEGRHLITLGGERHTFTGLIPLTSVYGARRDDPRRRARRIPAAACAEGRDPGAPAAPRGSTRSRSRTGCAAPVRTEARAMWTLTARTVFGAEPSELSFLYFLWYAQCAGGVMQLTDFEGGAQDAHLAGGTQQLCDRIAAELGDDVLLGSPATAIKHDADGVSIKVGRRRLKAVEGGRRGVTRARRPDRLRPGAAGARRARPADAHGRLHEGRCDLRPRVVARPGPLGACVRGPRAGADDGRREPAGRRARSPRRFRDGRARACGRRRSSRTRAGMSCSRRWRAAARARRRRSPRSYRDFNWHEERWSRGGPVGLMGPGHAHGARPAAARARRPAALGGHRHRDRVERLHGGRDPGGRAGRRARSAPLGRELLDAVAAGPARRLDGDLVALGAPQQGLGDRRLR